MISEHAVAGEARLAALPTAHRLADVVNAANVNHVVLPFLEDLAAELTDVLKAANTTHSLNHNDLRCKAQCFCVSVLLLLSKCNCIVNSSRA